MICDTQRLICRNKDAGRPILLQYIGGILIGEVPATGQRVVTINPTIETTPELAIETAFEFAQSLRRSGWKAADEEFARSLWVEKEFGSSRLFAYLVAGFDAGNRSEPKPSAQQINAPIVRKKPTASRRLQ